MRSLKWLFLTTAVLCMYNLKAQTDVTLNVSNALLYEFNVNYESRLNENITLSGFGGYVYGFPDQYLETKFFYLGPEVRYYTSPKNGVDRFYFGFYARYKDGYTESEVNESGYLIDNGQYAYFYQTGQQDYVKVALGFTVGAKWIANRNLVYGIFAGFGRNLVSNYTDADFESNESKFIEGTYDRYDYRSDLDSEYWDFRVGFNLGWRF